MHPQLQEITATIRRARAELLDSYSVDALYALRVAIRRCRAILKQADTHSAHRLRKSWGGLATLSNRARDWDVFLLQAAELLTARESRRFEEANRRDIDSARDAVTDMLGSSLWRRHMDDWLEYTERAEGRAFTPEQSLAYLDRARAKVLLARERALQADDNHSWHKLRIAVKELRYVADAALEGPGAPARWQDLVEECKLAQSLLGQWHDTVVQLHMLDELEQTALHARLRGLIEGKNAALLSQMHDKLAGDDELTLRT
jgi:CHAD domain-containing protein